MQMLSRRFINPRVLTVLPFYLEATFQDVQITPTYRAFLPPPSNVSFPTPYDIASQSDEDTASNPSEGTSVSASSAATLVDSLVTITAGSTRKREGYSIFNQTHSLPTATMTQIRLIICRVIEMVRGCKEAIFAEYEMLYQRERPVPNRRKDRDDFEALLYNWEWCV